MSSKPVIDEARVTAWKQAWEREFASRWAEFGKKLYPHHAMKECKLCRRIHPAEIRCNQARIIIISALAERGALFTLPPARPKTMDPEG